MTALQMMDRYRKADRIWHLATDALLIGDHDEFDRLMREFRQLNPREQERMG